MTGLGELLREAREAKGYSLDDLQSITKIQKRYLSGIEKEDYSMMPGAFYARAFIKQYAEAVDLDPQDVLRLYKEEGETEASVPNGESSPTTREETSQLRARRRQMKTNDAWKQVVPKLLFAVTILAIIAGIYFLVTNKKEAGPSLEDPIQKEDSNTVLVEEKEPPKQTVPVEEDEETEEDEEEEREEVEPSVDQTIDVVNVEGDTTTYTLSDAETFKLRIEVSGDSWIGILTDAQEELTPGGASVLTDGDVVELDVTEEERIRIRIGRTSDVTIYVNDEPLEYAQSRPDQTIYIQYEK